MIRLRTITLAAVSAFIATVTAAGCGSSGDSGFVDKDGDGKPDNDGTSGPGGNVSNGFDGGPGGGDGLPPDQGQSNCAATGAEAKLQPVNLVFMFDKSGSMEQPRDKKWDPIVAAAESFFADGQSGGMNAALTFFSGSSCSSGDFDDPKVLLTKLPNATSFATAFAGEDPSGGTPTVAAIGGAITQAKSIANSAAHKSDVTAIVLATDGRPEDNCFDGCSEDCQGDQQCKDRVADCKIKIVATQAQTARTQAPGVRTYVIGVTGNPTTDKLDRLNEVAVAGGTTKANIVNADDPDKTKKDFIAALAAIRSQNLSCDFAIPSPPGGGKINYDAVRVNYTSGKGVNATFPYSETCAGNNGWRYDNKAAPTKISLCSNTCKTVQGDAGGKIKIAFDCQGTQPDGGTGGVH